MEAAEKLRRIAFSDPKQIRSRFGDKPITFLRAIDSSMRFPKKLRIIFACLWLEQDLDGKPATRFIIKGPRGGGKSRMVGAVNFVKWYLQQRNMVVMGGSLEQAKGVYNYFSEDCYSQPTIVETLPSEPTMVKTFSDLGNYFKAVAASQKQVRGPHPDTLTIDEACETKDELIMAAMPMVNTSRNPLIIMTSTFHKIFGYFQETWDEAPRLGWVRFSWDMFDVTAPFDPSIWSNPKLLEEIPDLSIAQAGEQSLEHRAAGRTGDPEGWVPVANIVQAWREKDSMDWFDVEYMGSRPSSTGMVNNPEDVDACIIPSLNGYGYRDGAEVIGGLDWGFEGMTAWNELMNHKDGQKVNLGERHWTQVRSELIIRDIIKDVIAHKIRFIYADGSHPFENEDLKRALKENKTLQAMNHRCTLVPVAFVAEKEWMIGNYRAYFQRRLLRIPKAFVESIWQHKRYRYKPGTDKVEKKDDHIPDSTQLALKHWPLTRDRSSLPKNEDSKQKKAIHSTETRGLLDEVF